MNSFDQTIADFENRILGVGEKVDNYVGSVHNRMILIDSSGSMAGPKIEHAKQALKKYCKKDDGIVAFSTKAYYISGVHRVDTISATGLTAMFPAIEIAIEKKPKNIIMITDGCPNVGGDASDIIVYVSGLFGVKIDCIGIGNPELDFDLDLPFLDRISKMTGGKMVHILNADELEGAIGGFLEYKKDSIEL